MNGQECHDYIDAYIDNELDISSTILVEHHLGDCPDCQQFLESRKAVGALLRRFELKSHIRFSGEFNLLFRFLDPM